MAQEDGDFKSKMQETGKQFADAAKDKAKKEIIKKIIAVIGAKGIAIIIVVALAATMLGVIVMAGTLYIDDTTTNESAKEAKSEAFPSDENLIGTILEIETDGDGKGKYKIQYKSDDGTVYTGTEAIEAKLSDIEENEMNFNEFTEEEIECLYNCLKAEWATSLPNLGGEVDEDDDEYIQGVITLYRHTIDSNNEEKEIPLKYEEYSTFTARTDDEALEYFSINDGKLVIATWQSNKVEYSFPDFYNYEVTEQEEIKAQYSDSENINIEFKEVDYTNLIGIHRFPFELGLALMIISEDADFVNELCDLALESEIQIGIFENITETVDITTVKITETTTYEREILGITLNVYVSGENLISGQPLDEYEYTMYESDIGNIPSSEEVEQYYTITTTYTDKNVSTTLVLNYVDSWFAKVEEIYEFTIEGPIVTLTEYNDQNFTEVGEWEAIGEPENDSYIRTYINGQNYERTEDILNGSWLETRIRTLEWTSISAQRRPTTVITREYVRDGCTRTVTEYKYEKTSTERLEVGEKFAKVYNNHPRLDGIMDTVASWVFEMLEDEESTIDYVSVLKYLLQITTGADYGISEEFDFTIESISIAGTSSIYTGKVEYEYLKVWENSYIWNYLNGISYYGPASLYITEDKTKYKIYYEASSDTYNFSYGLNLTGGDYETLFAENGLDNPSSYCHDGATADVDKLDAVFEGRVNLDKAAVIASTNGINLSNEQIIALLAIKYQYGNIGNFKTVYSAADGNLEEFKENFFVNTEGGGKVNPFKHGQPQNRADANWKLFSEGIYLDSSGNEMKGTSNIIDVAEEVHTYMEENLYSYDHTNGVTPDGMRNQRVVNCISFVTWVYCEAGYIDEVYTSCGTFQDAITTGKYKEKFIKIDSYEELQPGDIMYFGNHDHAEIYAGDGFSYNAGTTDAIRRNEPTYKGKNREGLTFQCGYRLK